MRFFPSILILVLFSIHISLSSGRQLYARRCKRTVTFSGIVGGKANSHGCSKNVWLGMDRASKCPQLNGAMIPQIQAINATTIVEASVQPRLYGRGGLYNANCEWMVIVVKRRGCILLDTESIEFKCRNNAIFYNGHEVSSYVCATTVFPEWTE